MKCFHPLSRSLLLLGLCIGLPASAPARIGDTQGQMDARILQPDLGHYFQTRGMDNRALAQLQRDLPTKDFAGLLNSADTHEVIYWKSAKTRHLDKNNGWRVHVFFWKGYSALEAYRRVGDSLSEFEVNAILNMNRGNQTWAKATKGKGVVQDSVIGYDFSLGQSLRAKVQGNWILIYSAQFDQQLIELKKQQDELAAQEAEKKKLERMQQTPESVAGF